VPYELYRVMHFLGFFLLMVGAGGMAVASLLGAPNDEEKKPAWVLGVIAHGVGLILVLVGGFGMLARMGYSAGEPWVLVKVVIWLVAGAAIVGFKRMPGMAKILFFVFPLLGATAGFMALNKPGHSGASKATTAATADAKASAEKTRDDVKKSLDAAGEAADKAKADAETK